MKKNINLIDLSDRLMDLQDKYAKVYPKFYIAELKYIQKKAELLMGATGLGSQPLRDAQVELTLKESQEYEDYHKLLPEITMINKQIQIVSQISRNITNSNWSETK